MPLPSPSLLPSTSLLPGGAPAPPNPSSPAPRVELPTTVGLPPSAADRGLTQAAQVVVEDSSSVGDAP
jgi:hypothetical protein